jgi:hypothetical protein
LAKPAFELQGAGLMDNMHRHFQPKPAGRNNGLSSHTIMRSIRWIAGFILGFGLPLARAETSFHSGPTQVALLELFTSEGCSSCPPAEQWLAGYRDRPELWREVVPVAWHVNYWNHLGWKDVYSSKYFTAREYAYASYWGTNSVYTPCFVRNGQEWRRGTDLIASPMAGGELKADWNDHRTCQIRYTPPPGFRHQGYVVTVTLLGSGIITAVKAGENAGRNLAHEFVALQTVSQPLVAGPKGSYSATFTLPASQLPDAPRHALAVWVSAARTLAPLQATGGWLD